MSKAIETIQDTKKIPQNGVSAPQGMVLRRQLLQCMAETLSPRQYQVSVLGFLEGMSQREIAYELNISTSTVSRAATASRYKIRSALGYEIVRDNYIEKDFTIFPQSPYPVQLPGIKQICC